MHRSLWTSLLLGLLIAPGSAAAQDFIGGLHLGLAATTIVGETQSDFQTRTGLAAGVWAGYQFRYGLSVRQEALYVTKGASVDTRTSLLSDFDPETDADLPLEVTFSYTYLEFPLLLVYEIELGRHLRPRLFAGPSLGFNQDAIVEFRVTGTDNPQRDTDGSIVSREWSFVGGIGADLDVGLSQRFGVGLRYTRSLSNIRTNDPPFRNSGIILFGGVTF